MSAENALRWGHGVAQRFAIQYTEVGIMRWMRVILCGSMLLGGFAQAAVISNAPLVLETNTVLNTSVNHTNQRQIFGGNAFGTFVAVNDGSTPWSMFGPSTVPAGSFNPGSNGDVAFTPVSQVGPTGSGTTADPFAITTVVNAGSSGIQVVQRDTLVSGDEVYRSDVTLTNLGTVSKEVIVYRAMDCYLGSNDEGFGQIIPSQSVACVRRDNVANPSNMSDPTIPISRVEQFLPLTAGANLELNGYGVIWNKIEQRLDFSNSCLPNCDTYQDNGMGMSWRATIAPGASMTFSHLTNFSLTGNIIPPAPVGVPTLHGVVPLSLLSLGLFVAALQGRRRAKNRHRM